MTDGDETTGTRTAPAGTDTLARADGGTATGILEATSAAVSRDSRIAIVGLGYVGLPLALAFVEAGCTVVGIDSSVEEILRLMRVKENYAVLVEEEGAINGILNRYDVMEYLAR